MITYTATSCQRTDLTIKASGRNLFGFAAPLYRLLLTGYLGIDLYGPPVASKAEEVQRVLNFRYENHQGDYERAISRILKPPVKDD